MTFAHATGNFYGAIPDGLRYDAEFDMWVRIEDKTIVIGATSYGLYLAGEIIAYTAKPDGATIQRGQGMATVECAKTVLAVHAPISFTLLAANRTLETVPQQLNADPYAAWMARGILLENAPLDHLIDANAYRNRVLKSAPQAQLL